jgi:hypothetical protein
MTSPATRRRAPGGWSLDRRVCARYCSIRRFWGARRTSSQNGATRVVPGSHRWDWDRVAKEEEITQATMPLGSVMFYTGSVMHGGGENGSPADRTAMNLTYIGAWLRQEENQYLTCPPEIARHFDPELRALLGYTMANYGLGYYSPVEFSSALPDTLPPEFAVLQDAGVKDADVGKAKTF